MDGNANFDDQVFLCSNDKDDNDCGFDGNFNHLWSWPVENCQIWVEYHSALNLMPMMTPKTKTKNERKRKKIYK